MLSNRSRSEQDEWGVREKVSIVVFQVFNDYSKAKSNRTEVSMKSVKTDLWVVCVSVRERRGGGRKGFTGWSSKRIEIITLRMALVGCVGQKGRYG